VERLGEEIEADQGVIAVAPNHNVKPLQVALNNWLASSGSGAFLIEDGVFGSASKSTMRAYQAAHKLTVSDQPTHELCDSLGIDLGPDFPYQPIGVKPPISINPLETMLIETALDAILPPSPAKEFLMFNFGNIVSIVVGLLPGLPDDVNKIRAAFNDLITDDPAKNNDTAEHLRDAARFARILADEADKVANALDPSGTAQPANPIVNK
jgi:peptidoglycan hydrolase-like protein with peptidoglycan-binding domain